MYIPSEHLTIQIFVPLVNQLFRGQINVTRKTNLFERIESRSVLDSRLGQIISSFRFLFFNRSSLSPIPRNLFHRFLLFLPLFLRRKTTSSSSFFSCLLFNRSTLVERYSRVSRNEEKTRRLNYGKPGNREQKETFDG